MQIQAISHFSQRTKQTARKVGQSIGLLLMTSKTTREALLFRWPRPYPLGPMSNPCVPNSIHATKPLAQLPLPLGVLQKNLSPYSTKPLSVRCSHMPLLDGSHSFVTLQPITWKFYTELHAGSLLVASFPPPPHDSFSRSNSLL